MDGGDAEAGSNLVSSISRTGTQNNNAPRRHLKQHSSTKDDSNYEAAVTHLDDGDGEASSSSAIPAEIRILMVNALFSNIAFWQLPPFFPRFCSKKHLD